MSSIDLNKASASRRVSARHVVTTQGVIDCFCLTVSFLVSLVVFLAFRPHAPEADLDSSWRYAMDAASAQHLPFGRAVVFTFGPLAALLTDFHVPEHDGFYLLLDAILVSGLVAVLALMAQRNRRRFLLLLPILLANLLAKDAIFFILPFALVMACSRRNPRSRVWGAAITIAAVAIGMLPLIKGTLSFPVVLCVTFAAILLLRQRSGWGIGMPALVIASLLGLWVAAGQQLADVPAFLQTQFSLAAGYTDAMSTSGETWVVCADLVVCIALFVVAMRVGEGRRVWEGVAFLTVAFVAFKAGFVRQDAQHVIIPASTLALLGYVMFLADPRRSAVLALVLGLGGWVVVAGHYVRVDPGADWARLAGAVEASARGIVTRIAAPEQLFAPYDVAKDKIRAAAGLSPPEGSADIYPFDQSLLLASDFAWSPRPLLQSYSAYTPELAAMDARHLEGDDAPSTLYFAVHPIDDRYPSLDDGASWPAILSRYDVKEFSGAFATLVRSTASGHAAVIGQPFLQGERPFDTDIAVPPDIHDVWATFRFHPTKSGRLLSLLFKRPILTMDVTYRDGRTRSARMIAGMAEGGFLLSPTITSARDFLGLKSGDPDMLAANEIRSFRLHQDSSIPFWGTSVAVELAPLTLQPDHSADRDLYGTLVPGQPVASLPVGGECWIDYIGEKALGDEPMQISDKAVMIQGWARLSTAPAAPAPKVRLALTGDDGRTWYSEARRTERPDVDAAFKLTSPAHVGYTALVDLRTLSGAYTVRVVQDGPDGPVTCPTQIAHIVHE